MKNKIRFKIDEKSLFLGTYNDYKKDKLQLFLHLLIKVRMNRNGEMIY